ncbi:MAG: hypothetical protein AAFV90_28180 [Cyanobacteria bacterium J06634_5]
MIKVQANRASKNFQQAATNLNQSCLEGLGDPIFSYWCKFYGENPDEQANSVKLLEPSIYNRLESKATVSKLLKEHNITDVFPATFLTVKEAIAHPNPVNIWFIKPFHLSGGRDIQVVAAADLPHFKLPKFNIVQAGIDNIQLIEGKKFTARIYLLIWNQAVYLFNDGFVIVHAPQYDKESTDYSVQVDHRGYESDESPVKMMLASELADFVQIMAKAEESTRKIRPVLQEAIAASSHKRYIFLGIDLLPLNDGNIKFIEINAIPNFIHSPKINQELNVPFFEHAMRVMYGIGSDRLTPLK